MKFNYSHQLFKDREDPICNHCVNEEHKFHKEIFWWVDEDTVEKITLVRTISIAIKKVIDRMGKSGCA